VCPSMRDTVCWTSLKLMEVGELLPANANICAI